LTNDQPNQNQAPPSVRWRWLRFVTGPLVLVLFIIIAWRHLDELDRLKDVSPIAAGALALLFLAARAGHTLTFKLLLNRLGHYIGSGELFLLNILMAYTNLLVPRMGTGLPGVYLKYKHGVSFAQYGSLLLPIVVLHAISLGLLGLIGQTALFWHSSEPINPLVALLFAITLAGGLTGFFLRIPIPQRWSGRFAHFFRRLLASWQQLGTARTTLAGVFSLRIVVLLFRVFGLQIAFWAIGQEVPFLGVFVATMLAEVAILASITPAGLGLREAAVAYSAAMLGCSPAMAISAAVLDRIVATICVLAIAQLGMWKLIRPMGKINGNT